MNTAFGRSQLVQYLGSIAFGLAVWEAATFSASRIIVAPPSAVAVRLFEGIQSGVLPQAFLGSLNHMVLGLAIAVAIALPLGILMGRSRIVSDVIEPTASAIYAIPPVAFVPMIVIWCGLYGEGRIAVVALMAVFEMLFTFSAGARNLPPSLIDVGRSFGAKRWTLVRKVMLPAMIPFIITGVRLGLVRAVHGMIVADLYLAAANLGAFMKRAVVRFDAAGILAVIVVLAVFGLILQEGLKYLERKFFWHGAAR